MSITKNKYILNLCETLPSFLSDYMINNQIEILSRDAVTNIENLSFIIVPNLEEANEALKDYDTIKNEIRIICVSEKGGIKDFLLSNGRLMIDKEIQDNFINKFILDKFFSDNTTLHLDESVGQSFDEIQRFNVTNHLVTGEFIDEISLYAFEKNHNLVSIRSFVDHLVYYFSYLKQSGLAGVPFEFEYGASPDVFVVNVHVSVKNFVAEYILDSFGKVNSKKPMDYLLGVVANSCDFIDITYIEENKKLSFTGYFGLNGYVGAGISFSNIKTATQIKNELESKIDTFELNSSVNDKAKLRKEKLEKKLLPGGLIEGGLVSFDNDSIFNNSKELVDELISHMRENFLRGNLEREISEFSKNDFNNLLPSFKGGELVDKIKVSDIEVLVERIKNEQSINAFDEEIVKAREEFKNDPSAIESLENTMSDEIAQKISGYVDLDLLNNLLNKDSSPSSEKESVFGEFKSNLPNFDASSAFDDIDPSFTNTSFNSDSIMDELENEFGDKSLDDKLAEIAPFSEPFDETETSFDSDNFDDILNKVTGEETENDPSQVVGGISDEDEFSQKISGMPKEEDAVFKVGGGSEDADDFITKISSMASEPESPFVTCFSSSNEDDMLGVFNVSIGNPIDQKKSMKMFVQNSLAKDNIHNAFDIKVKAFVEKKAPERLNSGLEHFANKLGKTLEQLSQDDLEKFQADEVPIILNHLLKDEAEIQKFKNDLEASYEEKAAADFQDKFKAKLENKVSALESIELDEGQYIVGANDLDPEDMNIIVTQTMKETFQDEFKFSNATPAEIDKKEKLVIKSLADTLSIPLDDVTAIVKAAANLAKEQEKQLVADKIYSDDLESGAVEGTSKTEIELISKLKAVADENKKLKTSLSALELEASANKNASDKFNQIVDGTDGELDVESNISSSLNEVEKKQIIEQIKEGIPLDAEYADKLSKSLENESQVIELAKNAENELKKAQYAADKKDTLFKQELTKAEKVIKAKEMVLDKAKESIKNLMGKKEKELLGLKTQVNELNQKLKDDQSTQLKTQVKALSKDKENLIKTAEVYKNKLESMAKNITKKAQENNGNNFAEENRNLERQKNQLENRISVETKMKNALEEKLKSTRQSELKLKTESSKFQVELKTAQSQLKLLKDQNAKLVKSAASSGSLNATKISKEAEALKAKNVKLQDKVSDLTKKMEAQNTPVDLGGMPVAELSQQRAQQELEKSMKEIDHMRDQNQKLQSKIGELQKKYQDAPIVSPENSGFVKALSKDSDEAKVEMENQTLKAKNEEMIKKLDDMTAKLQEAELSKPAPSGNAKEKRLEQSVKKMNQEIQAARLEAAEKKKDAIKYKTEVTGLKNQLAKLQKDLERAQKHSKAGAKKKAA